MLPVCHMRSTRTPQGRGPEYLFSKFCQTNNDTMKKKANKHHTIPSEANAPQRLPPR